MHSEQRWIIIILVFYGTYSSARKCNEVICASVVSKCMLTQACKCEITKVRENCSCCVECAKCLGQFFQRCCSCLDMCEEEAATHNPKESIVGEIEGHFLALFKAILNESMIEGANIHTYKEEWQKDKLQKKLNIKVFKEAKSLSNNRLEVDCSVAYLSQCYSVTKCREQCKDYGAGYYRYFYDGCCQCIGPTCHNYGIDKSQCRDCTTESIESLRSDDSHFEDDPIYTNGIIDDRVTKRKN